MGLLDELIVLVKETIAEAHERNDPRPAAPDADQPRDRPHQRSAEEMEALRRSLARRAAEMRMAEQDLDEAAADQERQRQLAERERHHQKQVAAVQAAQVVHQHGGIAPHRITQLIRQPNALREMIVLREILDKPLALRSRH